MGSTCGIEVKFVATITSFSSTFSELSPMFSHLGHPFSSCVKNDASLNYKTSLNFTSLLHRLAISAGLHSVGTQRQQSTLIFSRISDNLFSTHTFHFLLTGLIHHKPTLESDKQTTFVMLTSTDNAFLTDTIKRDNKKHFFS